MDEQAIDARGLAPLHKDLLRIAALAIRFPNSSHTCIKQLGNRQSAFSVAAVRTSCSTGSRPRFDNASTLMANVGPDGLAMPTR